MGLQALLSYSDEYLLRRLISVYIKERRLKLGYTIADTSKAVDMDRKQYQKIESGKTLPNDYEFERLRETLEFSDQHIEKLCQLAFVSYLGEYFELMEVANG